MKGKIFKRVASAMLGLMVAFAAIGVNTAFADDDPTIKDTKPKIIVTNYQNDGTEAGSLVHCDVILVLTADEKFNGKEVEFDSVKYTVEFPTDFIKASTPIYHKELFPTTGYQQTFALQGQNTVNGTIAKTDPHAKSLKGTIGQNIPVARISVVRNSELTKTAQIQIKGVVTECKNGEVASVPEAKQTYVETDCIHPADKVTYSLPEDTTEAQKYHYKNCGECNASLIKEIHKEKGNIKTVTGTADILAGTYGKCVCGILMYKINNVKGTETKTPDGNNILGNPSLNAVEKEYFDSKGARCGSIIAVDATNFYNGGRLDINTNSADTVNDFYVWKNSVITVDGKNAADPGKKVIFVAREITGDLPFDQFVELYKKFGGQGSVISREITHNGKRYMCAWESGINPYFVSTSVAAENKKEDPKKGTQTKTGDAAGLVCLAASGLLVVAGLYMELMKKKKNA